MTLAQHLAELDLGGTENNQAVAPLATPARREFVKSSMKQRQEAEARREKTDSPVQKLRNMIVGVPANYRGDAFSRSYQILPDLPDEENVCFWVSGLPADVTTKKLLAPITRIGRVYMSNINHPSEDKSERYSAAKIAFFTKRAATLFWNTYGHYGLPIRPWFQPGKIVRNRNKMQEERQPANFSRVLVVKGLEVKEIKEFLNDFLVYTTSDVITSTDEDGKTVAAEFRFASWRGQANQAFLGLLYTYGKLPGFSVEYGIDPCGTD